MAETIAIYEMPNGRVYKIDDTGVPFKLGYPEINDNVKHLTMNTGVRLFSQLNSGVWNYVCSTKTLKEAMLTLQRLARVPLKDIPIYQIDNKKRR